MAYEIDPEAPSPRRALRYVSSEPAVVPRFYNHFWNLSRGPEAHRGAPRCLQYSPNMSPTWSKNDIEMHSDFES